MTAATHPRKRGPKPRIKRPVDPSNPGRVGWVGEEPAELKSMPHRKLRDYVAIANDYARTAADPANSDRFCRETRAAAQRQLTDLTKGVFGWDFHFDAWHACDVCEFIERLPHVEGSWNTKTITLEPAQVFWLTTLFGWRRADGTRRFRVAYLEMARKNAKSTIAAGLALYCLLCEGENGPQVIIGATTGAQAQKVFSPAKQMVDRSPELRENFLVQAWAKTIVSPVNSGFIQTINAKAKTQDG